MCSQAARQVVVVGLPETAAPILDQLASGGPGSTLRGVVMLRPDDLDRARRDGLSPLLGVAGDLPALHATYRFDTLLVSIPRAMDEAIQRLRRLAEQLGVAFRFAPTLADALAGDAGVTASRSLDVVRLVGREARPVDADRVRTVVAGKRVVITGAGGSIGSELCRIVGAHEPAEMLMIERSENALFEIDREIATRFPGLPRRALLHDVVEEHDTASLFEQHRPDVVFHAAAHKHVPMMEDHPAHAVNNNVFGTKSVADAALAVGVERFVLVSTDKAVNPSSVMGATKRFAELYVRSLNGRGATRFSMVRFGNVLGSSGSVLTVWSRQLAAGRPLTITDRRMTRYFMTIPEAAALVIQSAGLDEAESRSADVFVLEMGEPVRIVDLARRFIESHGLTARDDSAPQAGAPLTPTHPIVFTGARPGEKLHEELAHESEQLHPTLIPGVQAWSGPPASPDEVDSMMRELSRVRKGVKPIETLRTVQAWTPGFEIRDVQPDSVPPALAGAA